MTDAHTVLPDYAGAGIANLMASLAEMFRASQVACPVLREDFGVRAHARTVVLMVVDGLGDEMLRTHAPHGALMAHRRGALSSVFPSTTASAITTFLTGVAPAQHAMTGWHIHVRAIGRSVAMLPFTLRGSGTSPAELGLPHTEAFDTAPFADRIDAQCHVVSPARIVDSAFNATHSGRAQRHRYNLLGDLFATTERCVRHAQGPCFVYAYWPDVDSIAHERGAGARQTGGAVRRFDEGFARLLSALRGQDVEVIVTGDHGLIDAPPQRCIELQDHPRLTGLLAHPLSGERRAAYCHVQPGCAAAFADYVRNELGEQVVLVESARAMADGWFGPPPYHPELAARIGDFILLGRGEVTVKDWLPGEKRYQQLAVHGGLSPAEMLVPLIVARPTT